MLKICLYKRKIKKSKTTSIDMINKNSRNETILEEKRKCITNTVDQNNEFDKINKIENIVNTGEILIENKERQSSRDLSQISNIQRSYHDEEEIHPIPSKRESNTKSREIQAHNSDNLSSTISTKSDTNFTIQESTKIEGNLMRDMYFHILPELKKIKCKIKRKLD